MKGWQVELYETDVVNSPSSVYLDGLDRLEIRAQRRRSCMMVGTRIESQND